MVSKDFFKNIICGFIIISLASCNSSNKVVSLFGKRKYTKGYFFNNMTNVKIASKTTSIIQGEKPESTSQTNKTAKIEHNYPLQSEKLKKQDVKINTSLTASKVLIANIPGVVPHDYSDTTKKLVLHVYGAKSDAEAKAEEENDRYDGFAQAGFWFSVFSYLVPFFLAVPGLILSIKGLKSKNHHTLAIIGIILSTINILGTFAFLYYAIIIMPK